MKNSEDSLKKVGSKALVPALKTKLCFIDGTADRASCVLGDFSKLATRPRVPKTLVASKVCQLLRY